jgi:hypothetical protein
MFYGGTTIGNSSYPIDAPTSTQPFRGAMAWVHWFDYSLSHQDALKDMKNKFSNKKYYVEDPKLIVKSLSGGSNKVLFYSGCDYTGKETTLAVDQYNFQKLMGTGYQNDTLQSVKVPRGTSITMWEHDIGGGRSLTLTADCPCLTMYNFMNTVSSCTITSTNGTPVVPQSGVQVTSATYGINCNPALKDNRLKFFQDKCNGKKSCLYTYNYTAAELPDPKDPAGGCAKSLEISYTCDGKTKQFSAPGEACCGTQIKLEC